MSNGFGLELQKGIRAALVADSDVTALVSTRIYDEPPHNVTFPYVRFGNIEPQTQDTDGSTGAEVTFSMMGFSRTTGRVEATQVAEAIRAALHRQESAVTLTGYNLIELRCETYFVDREEDERGHAATVVMSALLETA